MMASRGFAHGISASALPSKNLRDWRGFRSREVWEMPQTSTCCTVSAYSTVSVASLGILRLSAKSTVRSASVHISVNRSELSSTFWGNSRLRTFRTSRKSDRAARRPASMPLVEARLFGPSIFNASKLRVLLLGKPDEEQPLQHPRIYTLTHSDVTAKITLAVAREINKAQVMGWYSKLQRDEVVAEWRKTQGEVSLHVHCHISGTNFLHRIIAKLRFYIFQKELPLVLEAFMHGDRDLFEKHPELQDAPVWVYFHSNVEDYNRVECWGPLIEATKRELQTQPLDATKDIVKSVSEVEQQFPGAAVCLVPCDCCSRHAAVIPIPESLNRLLLQSQKMSFQLPSSKRKPS